MLTSYLFLEYVFRIWNMGNFSDRIWTLVLTLETGSSFCVLKTF